MSVTTLDVRAVQYELEIVIEADPETVWKALTEEIQAWWLPDFHMVGPDSVVSLEARAGGQLLETSADGGGLLWYTVQMCTSGKSLHLVGHVAPDWSGPATSMLKISLEERDSATLLRFQDAQFGHVTDSNVESLREGWAMLLGVGLKGHVEAR